MKSSNHLSVTLFLCRTTTGSSNMIKEIEKKRKSLDDQRSRLIKGVTDVEGQIREDQERIRTLIIIYQVVL